MKRHAMNTVIHSRSLAFAIVSVAALHARASAQCLDWASGFQSAGASDTIYRLATFDDGQGDALYATGIFDTVGDAIARRIAKWNGTAWSALGSGLANATSVQAAEGHALMVFDDGSGPALFVGGVFASAGGTSASCVAKWNGSTWSALGNGLQGRVDAFVAYDDPSPGGARLYAGGDFSIPGYPLDVNDVAMWNGTSWVALGTGVDYWVRCMAVFDDGSGPQLYVGGFLTNAQGNVARWNGSIWSPVGSGFPQSSQVTSMVVFDDGAGGGPALYASAQLSPGLSGVSRWNGTTWSAVGTNLVNVSLLFVHDDGSGPALYADGQVGSTYSIVRWNGAAWSAIPSNTGPLPVQSVAEFDDGSGAGAVLYAAGAFREIDGQEADRIAKRDGASWSTVSSGRGCQGIGLDALVVHDDGLGPALYANDQPAVVSRLGANGWTHLGYTFGGGTIKTLLSYDDGQGGGPTLLAGGTFDTADGGTAAALARWDGTDWTAFQGGGFTGGGKNCNALIAFDEPGPGPIALYATGGFLKAGGNPVTRIARYDGVSWSAPGGVGLNANGLSLAVFDDGSGSALYVGGLFGMVGSVPASCIARWNGATWSALGSGTDLEVRALAVFDDGSGPALFAGGNFHSAGGAHAEHIAKWNGTSWSPVGASGFDDTVVALAVFDDGSGPALYAGGPFTTVDGVSASHVARWNGSTWSALGSGTNARVNALAVFDEGAGSALFAGGAFVIAGGKASSYIGKWSRACTCAPLAYCTAGTSSNGCTPSMSASGTASASGAGSFVVTASGVDGQRTGLLFYGMSGATSSPWGATSSFLCVKPPQQRTGQTSTGGTPGACDGALVLDFNAYVASHPGSLGQPFSAGDTVRMQGWYRDPPNPKTTSLTDALEFYLCP